MAILYADEDFSGPVVVELRQLGHDVLSAHDAGQANQGFSDAQQLVFAISLGRAVLTHNRWDFIRLHKRVRPHNGIIVCSKDDDYAAQAQMIRQALLACPDLTNQLIRIHKS